MASGYGEWIVPMASGYGEWIVPYGEWIVPNLRIPWKRRRSSLPYVAVGTCEILNGIDWDCRREASSDGMEDPPTGGGFTATRISLSYTVVAI
jgi:hypothetical protein